MDTGGGDCCAKFDAARIGVSTEGEKRSFWGGTTAKMLDNKLLDITELGIINRLPVVGFVLRDMVCSTSSLAGKDFSSKMTCHEMYTHLAAKSRHLYHFLQLE